MKWTLVAPISYKPMHGFEDGLRVPFSWDDKVTLARIPEWVRERENAGVMSAWQRDRMVDAELALMAEYEPDRPCFQPDLGEAQEWLRFVLLSVWIVRPCDFTYEFIFERSVDGTGNTLKMIEQITRTFADPRDEERVLRQSDLETSGPLFSRIVELSRSDAVWLSLFALWRGLTEKLRFPEFRAVLLWIGLEALFGAEQPGESTHKIAERMAIFLEPAASKRPALFRAVKASYGMRSKVVHGLRPRKRGSGDDTLEKLYQTQEWLRTALLKILSDDELVDRFGGVQRETFLNELVLS